MSTHLHWMIYQFSVRGIDRKTIQEQDSGSGSNSWFNFYVTLLIIYAGSHLFVALLLNMPLLRRQAEKCSHFGPIPFLNWVHQVYLSFSMLLCILLRRCKFVIKQARSMSRNITNGTCYSICSPGTILCWTWFVRKDERLPQVSTSIIPIL